jgi:hypothetical protein
MLVVFTLISVAYEFSKALFHEPSKLFFAVFHFGLQRFFVVRRERFPQPRT